MEEVIGHYFNHSKQWLEIFGLTFKDIWNSTYYSYTKLKEKVEQFKKIEDEMDKRLLEQLGEGKGDLKEFIKSLTKKKRGG